jgi:GTPase SAR1 family protein
MAVLAEVGKTTLAASLGSSDNVAVEPPKDAATAAAARTRGVEVRPLSIAGGADFSLWDYAGQEEASC